MGALKKYDKLLYETIIEKDLSTIDSLKPILIEAELSGESFLELLVRQNLFLENDLLNILAEKLNLSRVSLKELSIEKEIIDKVPLKVASYYKFIPVEIQGRVLAVIRQLV